MDARWLPVVGYEGCYEVSDQGRVRSLTRTHFYTTVKSTHIERIFRSRLIKPYNHQGYNCVTLHLDCNVITRKICSLVLGAFSGPRPSGLYVCHNDGNPGNDWLANLRYDTQKGNLADIVQHGTHQRGEAHPSHRLTEADIHYIRSSSKHPRLLGAELGVHRIHIINIRNGKRWQHLLPDAKGTER